MNNILEKCVCGEMQPKEVAYTSQCSTCSAIYRELDERSIMTEQKRQNQCEDNIYEDAFDKADLWGARAANRFIVGKLALLELYKSGEITLKQLNEEF